MFPLTEIVKLQLHPEASTVSIGIASGKERVMNANKYLRIYLVDHQAASVAGFELAKRTLGSNRGTGFEADLAPVVEAIGQDKEALEAIMRDRFGVSPNPVKGAATWVAEKLGRAKLNGELLSYSPLSRVVEFEGLVSGIAAKRALWVSLKGIAADHQLDTAELDHLIERAETQLTTMQRLRDEAAVLAFSR